MPVFTQDSSSGGWLPSPLAAGPFAGLQGGAIAGLLTAEIEAFSIERGWGLAVNSATWFLKPTPMAPIRTQMTILHEGGRATVVDNSLFTDEHENPTATARVLLLKERKVEVPGLEAARSAAAEPERLARVVPPPAGHGGPWFMDTMDMHPGPDMTWFKLHTPVVENAGPLARVLGAADWAHGINRPRHNVVADPNPNLSVHLFRPPLGDWIGVQAKTFWTPDAGCGHGYGNLWDEQGEIGSVAMAVALIPIPPVATSKGDA